MLLTHFQSCTLLCLTDNLGYIIISEKLYSTVQVAGLLGIPPATLHRWIREKRIVPPPLQSLAGMEVRVWSRSHLEEVRKYKNEHYWGRGIKKPRQKKRKGISGTRRCANTVAPLT